jgi:hypothetical protein
MPMQVSFAIGRAGVDRPRPCLFTPIADDIVWQRAPDIGEFLHKMHITLLLGAGLGSSELLPILPRGPEYEFMLLISLNHQPQISYVNMPLFSHRNVGQIGGTLVLNIMRYCRGMFRQRIRHHCAKVSCIRYPYHWFLGVLVAADIRSCREICSKLDP